MYVTCDLLLIKSSTTSTWLFTAHCGQQNPCSMLLMSIPSFPMLAVSVSIDDRRDCLVKLERDNGHMRRVYDMWPRLHVINCKAKFVLQLGPTGPAHESPATLATRRKETFHRTRRRAPGRGDEALACSSVCDMTSLDSLRCRAGLNCHIRAPTTSERFGITEGSNLCSWCFLE
jgi:hypothetical protein